MKTDLISRWYIDVRSAKTSDLMSFDLAQHLPRRLSIGPALVITDHPAILLSVIRKRWMKLLHDIETQRSRTLDRRKRDSFAKEIAHLHESRFTSKERLAYNADALFATAAGVKACRAPYTTIYLTTTITPVELAACLTHLRQGGLLAVYGEWHTAYDGALAALG